VKNQREARTPEILAHEQAHFDISEITARRLRKALLTETYSRKNLEQKINSIYQVTIQAGDEMQALYDQESDHGLNKTQQLKWSNRVKNELSELANYAR
jgi:predicted secreted Zn-dependent protease